jgi:hypothetical protein
VAIDVSLQLVIVGVVPPQKLRVLSLWVEPNPVPVITMDVPIRPEVGDIPVTLAPPLTVNVTELLVTPPTVTVAGPVVAPLGT